MQQIKEFLKKYNFKPNDLLGQNFLIDDLVLEQIAAAAELQAGDEVLEIGSGIGNLTKKLAVGAKFVLGVEKDQRYFPILKNELGGYLQTHTKTPSSKANVQIAFSDILTFNFQEILNPGYKVVANIPYYISGQIIEMLLAAKNRPSKIVLLVQKEVAQRIIAPKGQLSILAISVQLHANPKMIARVPKESFYPQPKVDSAILVLDILAKPRVKVDEKIFFRVIKACFSGKRKQIHNTLKNNLGLSSQKVNQILEKAGVDHKARPQELSLEQWQGITEQL